MKNQKVKAKIAFESAEIDLAICVWDPLEELEPLIPSFISSSSSAYVTLTKSENLWWIDLDFNLPPPEKKISIEIERKWWD